MSPVTLKTSPSGLKLLQVKKSCKSFILHQEMCVVKTVFTQVWLASVQVDMM